MTKAVELHRLWNRLAEVGILYDDAQALRRISMTLHRWHELECGDSNDYHSWVLVRGHKVGDTFEHDDNGAPYIERHENRSTRADGKWRAYWTPLPDREAGARKRLAKIMARYPGLQAYVQTDPRGCALYILVQADIPAGAEVSSCYTRGLAVYR